MVVVVVVGGACSGADLALKMLDELLRRLQTDHLDLWQIHGVCFDNEPALAYANGGFFFLAGREQNRLCGRSPFVDRERLGDEGTNPEESIMRPISNAYYVSGDEVGRGEARLLGFDHVLQHSSEIRDISAENTVILDYDSPLFGDKESLAECIRRAAKAGATIAIHTRHRRDKAIRRLRREFPHLLVRSSLRKLYRVLFASKKPSVVFAAAHETLVEMLVD